MNWTLISNTANAIKEYHLVQDEQILAVMKCNLEQETVRIAYGHDRLTYIMEQAGSRIIFRNTYGIELGKCVINGSTGRLEIDNEVYDFQIVDNAQPRLVIHQRNQHEPVAVSQLPATATHTATLYELAALVLGLCRLTAMPAVRKSQD